MLKIISTFIILCICSNISYSQNADKSYADTSHITLHEYIVPGLNPLNEFYYTNFKLNPNLNNAGIWTKTLSSLNYHSGGSYISEDVSKNMLAPLRLKYLDSQKFSILREILGAAQMTAAGIMAYQHIKRYGFIKQTGRKHK